MCSRRIFPLIREEHLSDNVLDVCFHMTQLPELLPGSSWEMGIRASPGKVTAESGLNRLPSVKHEGLINYINSGERVKSLPFGFCKTDYM